MASTKRRTPAARARKPDPLPGEIPQRPLGRTGVMVSALGLGGYHLGTIKDERQAVRIVREAIDGGITFMDNAWEYHQGRAERVMGKALAAGGRDKVFLMTKVCTHGRGRKVAMAQLEESLTRLRTDHLDLWQVHEVVYENDPELAYARGGVLEALEQARAQGKTRFVGFTGHKDPRIHLDMLTRGFPFDTCQLPLNCFDASFRSFETQVLPELERRRIAAIGMKPFGSEGEMLSANAVPAEEALRYAMSLPVATTVTGIDSPRILRQDLRIARSFQALDEGEMEALRRRVASRAGDGRYELYKTSMRHDGPEGREQHGFPSDKELGV
jgi:aryl-alcohol dehydrogenase-like predicted oxidoreductase